MILGDADGNKLTFGALQNQYYNAILKKKRETQKILRLLATTTLIFLYFNKFLQIPTNSLKNPVGILKKSFEYLRKSLVLLGFA